VPRRSQADRRTDTRARLLNAAAGLFAERGFDSVSVDEVAAAADRSSGAVYAHFGSKQGLLRALLQSSAASTSAVVAAEFAVSVDDRSRMAALWDAVAQPPGDQGPEWLLLEHELWLRAVRSPDLAHSLRQRYSDVRRSIAAGYERRGLDARAATDLSVQVMALLMGLEMQHRLDPEAVSDETAVLGLNALLAAALDGTAACDPSDFR
jgi:AcrR family transcriptional regulator